MDGANQGKIQRKNILFKRYPLSFWKETLKEFEGGTLSAYKFCLKKGIGFSTFQRWKKVIGNNAGSKPLPSFIPIGIKGEDPFLSGLSSQDLKEDSNKSFDFKPLTSEPFAKRDEWILMFGTGVSLKIPDRFDDKILKRLVSVLIPCS